MRTRLGVPLLFAVLVAMLPSSPAAALFEIYQPDVFVQGGVGEGVHDATGAGQIKSLKVRPGGSKLLSFWNRNDGNTTDTFTYWGCGNKGPFNVNWLDWTGTNVSAATTAGTFTTSPLDPGWSEAMLSLDLHVRSSAVSGRHLRCTVLATSAGNGVQDRAGYKITVR